MSYNDPKDVEAVLQVPPTPPAATPALVRGTVSQPVPSDPIPQKIGAPPTPVAVPSAAGVVVGVAPLAAPSSPPKPIQTQAAARSASVQLVPVDPPAQQTLDKLTQTTLATDGVNAAPQTPATTTPGTVTQS